MFNAARVPQSRRREQQPYELSCTLAGRWMKFWPGISMLESRSSGVSEAWALGVTMAFSHGENAFIPAAPSSWSVCVKQHLDNSTARLQNPWSQCEMVLLAARLVHPMSRDSELFHLTTFVSSADHASSDGNSIRTWRQHGSGRPSKLLKGVLPNMSTPWSSPVC